MFDQTGKASYVHNIHKFMSLKNDAVVRTMSALEFDFCHHLEYNSNIESFISQPDGFFYQFNGRKCRYTPDFYAVGSNNQSIFFEVKLLKKTHNPNFRARFAVKQRVARELLGHDLYLVTERQIRATPLLNNLKLLRRYSGLHTVTENEISVLEYVQYKKKARLSEVSKGLSLPEYETLISALNNISTGRINADLINQEFGLNNLVWS